jgi:hypothetical protein
VARTRAEVETGDVIEEGSADSLKGKGGDPIL